MENAEYCSVQFKIAVPKRDDCEHAVSVDGIAPSEYTESKSEFIYIFLLPRGQHTVEIRSIPTAKNGIGKLCGELLSATPYKRYLNHLAAFHYNIESFVMKIQLRIHRDAFLTLGTERKNYVNFLNTYGTYLYPFIADFQNIKRESISVRIFDSVKQKHKFYRNQAFFWTLYCLVLLIIFGTFAVTNILNWNIDSGIAGHNGASLFFMGSFPVILLTVCSYFYHINKLYKQYKDGFLSGEIYMN